METDYKEEIADLIKGQVLFNEPLKNHTSFKIGGPAEILVIPTDEQDLKKLITYLYHQELPYQVIGNGTNILISDQGLSNIVIKLSQLNSKIEFNGQKLKVGAGINLPLVARKAAQRGLSGLEFGVGLPATIGGAVVMNAGLGDLRSIGDLITKVKVLLPSGEIKKYYKEELDFDYRSSIFQDSKEIILEVELELILSNSKVIIQEMEALLEKRKGTQPLSLPNAGCIFKNPPNDSAGRLIDQAGGKGLKVGDAQVSTKHANFIVNLGEATAQDVLNLIAEVQDLVYDKFGVRLSREINFLS